MKQITINKLLTITLLSMLIVNTAYAEKSPYTLQVPVDLKNLNPEIKQVLIQCGIHNDKATPSVIAIGDSKPKAVDKNRNLKTTFIVSTEVFKKADQSKATSYSCQLSYLNKAKQPVSFEKKDKLTQPKKGKYPYKVLIKGKI